MTSQQFLVCDNSTATNYKAWASALSNQIRTFGWTNSADTGQLNGAGANNWAGVTTVPGSGAFYYEIFKPGDALTVFYLKVEYGNSTGAVNSPTLRLSIGTGTDGAGNLTGLVTSAPMLAGTSFVAPSTTTTYECDMSGTSSRLSILMWRNAPNSAPQLFAVQRSLNASGAETGTYATLWTGGKGAATGQGRSGFQQSLHFTIGPAPVFPNTNINNVGGNDGWPARVGIFNFPGTSAFNGTIPIDFLQPCVGFWDYPCTAVGVLWGGDTVEGVPFSVTNQYGQTKTYMPTKVLPLSDTVAQATTGLLAVCLEYD